jgi:hypothetical protein
VAGVARASDRDVYVFARVAGVDVVGWIGKGDRGRAACGPFELRPRRVPQPRPGRPRAGGNLGERGGRLAKLDRGPGRIKERAILLPFAPAERRLLMFWSGTPPPSHAIVILRKRRCGLYLRSMFRAKRRRRHLWNSVLV